MNNGDLVIDADGHILEPPDLWERYLEPQYRDRAIRLKRDSEGWEYLEIGGQASKYCTRGALTRLGSMGREIDRMKERRARSTSRSSRSAPMRATPRTWPLARWTPRSVSSGWIRKG
jgi:hypothetical protein